MMGPAEIYSVTEITKQIKSLLENNLSTVWVRGELSNFTHHTSGHMYFTLKDDLCQIRCVMWEEYNARLFFTPQDGMKVLAQGDVTVYERAGQYQFRVLQLQPVGVGDLQMAFERLKEKLLREGLFDEEHKKPIPLYPQSVGVISSPSGAVFRDIVHIINRRFPGTHIVLNPVRVQGDGAAGEIARAIDEFNRCGEVDVLIVTRGGGSLEDLWAFNEEVVARAIFRSEIPVISAVGHEVDFTIADFVADLRAPTPSAAAELVVPDGKKLLRDVRTLAARAKESLERRIQSYQERLDALTSSYGLRHPADMIRQCEQRRDELVKGLCIHITHFIQRQEQAFSLQLGKLEGLGPPAVLKRGYSICRKLPGRTVVREADSLRVEDTIEVTFHRGSIEGVVEKVRSE
ncbi:MAG: exodeoxyribonuclease VII large subunit [bacterium]